MTDYKAAWRGRTRAWAFELLGGKCARCSSPDGLDFDHVDPGTKEFEISVGIRNGYGRERLAVELAKCQLLCKECHREKTALAGETGGGWNKVEDPLHGTAVMYGKGHECRCPLCVQWKRDYREGLVDSRGVARAVIAQLV